MLRKHHKLIQGDKTGNSDVFLLLFWTLNNDRLNLHTNSYNISVTQQQFSLVSLGCLWSDVTESLIRQIALENILITTGFILQTAILLQTQ